MSQEETSKACPNCGGRGFRYVDGTEGVVKCECKNEDRIARLMKGAEIPRRYANCTLENYIAPPSTENPYLALAHIKANAYADDYFMRATPKGLLFQGPPGLGKTHLAVGIIRRLIETKGVSCFFCNFAAELQRIRDSMSSAKTLVLPRLVYDAEVVILDDFGSQRWSSWVQDQMSNVISNRYNDGRSTIITTNLSDKVSADRVNVRIEAMKKLGVMNSDGQIDNFQMARLEQCGIRFTAVRDEPETLEDQIGDRLRSRLHEMCDVVPMFGQDYRRLRAERDRSIIR
jgi:DNA replication protein DnaC